MALPWDLVRNILLVRLTDKRNSRYGEQHSTDEALPFLFSLSFFSS